MKKIMLVYGTRPEAIKMAPLSLELKKDPKFTVLNVVTAQHRQMLDSVLGLFGIKPEYDLDMMKPGQDLYDVTTNALTGLKAIIQKEKPDMLLVQGDTTTAFAGALAAFYQRIPVGHVEAGLRTFQKYAPFPEEINRKMVSVLADVHFVPTKTGETNLVKEGIDRKNIYITGNTVIDALFLVRDRFKKDKDFLRTTEQTLIKALPPGLLEKINGPSKMILITGHRRENFGQGFLDICHALKKLSKDNPRVNFIYPVHLNPNVRTPVMSILKDLDNFHLVEPVNYREFVYMMSRSTIIVTDSGGVQEEAPSLGKPVLVMRDVTERPEAVQAGTVKLVGTSIEKIVRNTQKLLDVPKAYNQMRKAINPYGDGKACGRIHKKIAQILG
jgi:UDP-N-acetylglucosamine 2-epimerase (non-hydrolysing)